MADETIRGRFVWHELMSGNPDAAGTFFARALGWSTQPFEASPGYRMFVAGGQPIGGLMALPAEAIAGGTSPCWVIYIATPDVDETAAQCAALGGKVLRAAEDIPFVGRFAMLADLEGAMFAAFTPQPSAGNGQAPADGTFSWHELATTDVNGAVTFYRRLFGWQEITSFDMGPEVGRCHIYGLDGKQMGGIYAKPPQMPGPPAWLAYVRVADAAKSAKAITAAGGTVVNGPMEVPGGDWIAQAVDPEGILFAVHAAAPVKRTGAAAAGRKTARKGAKNAKKKAVARKRVTPARKKAAPVRKKTAPAKKKAVAKKKPAARTRPVAKKRPAARKKARRR